MAGQLNIVPGEAPESDEEDLVSQVHTAALQGTAIMGEASESDSSSDVDEAGNVNSVGSASSALSALSFSLSDIPKAATVTNLKEDSRYNSLLHKKLKERNASFRKSVDDFIHLTTGTAARDLNSIDQHLLKSQVTLQEAATSLRLLQSNLSHIHSRLSFMISLDYLPAINIHNL